MRSLETEREGISGAMNHFPSTTTAKMGPKNRWHAAGRNALGILSGLGVCIGALQAAAIPEPDTVFYGRVLNYDHGHDLLLTEGELEWTIHPEGDGGRAYQLRATLEPLANGTLSYRMKVPHAALSRGITLADIPEGTVPLNSPDTRFTHASIRVNGELARVLAPASLSFKTSTEQRAAAHRVDLEIAVPMPDSDGHGLPDWWQQKFFGSLGTDPNADPDHDGWSNLREYLSGTNPNFVDKHPAISWEDPVVNEGATQILTMFAVDSDTPADHLVYTLTEEPQGASVRLLFGEAGVGGEARDKVLHTGSTFTQAQLDEGLVVLVHESPSVAQFHIGFRLEDGDVGSSGIETNFNVQVRTPTAVDGSDAVLWLDGRDAAPREGVSVWQDRSGPKTWLTGLENPYDATAVNGPLPIVDRGPVGQPVVAFGGGTGSSPSYMALPTPDQASVFDSGELTVFAVINPRAVSKSRQQIVNGANFQLALAGENDRGRAGQVRFAAEGVGAVYGNHEVQDQWTLVTAWRQEKTLNLEMNGAWVGGPKPQDEAIALGTAPSVGVKNSQGKLSEPFLGDLAELIVFNRNVEDAARQRINSAMLSKWFGWVILDGSEEQRDMVRRVPSTGLTPAQYRGEFIPKNGPDRHYVLIGGGGFDLLQGGMNDDIIIGGRQADVMSGGGGSDRFIFNFSHINHGDDTITDYDPKGDRDVLDIADLLRGTEQDLRKYLHLRTDGHRSFLDIDFAGQSKYDDHTIVLSEIVLRDEDLYSLWAEGGLITGDKRFPLSATLSAARSTITEAEGDTTQIAVHFAGGPSVPLGVELPFVVDGSAVRGVDYNLSVSRFSEAQGAYGWEAIRGQGLKVFLKPGDLDLLVRVEPIQNARLDAARTVRFALTPVPELYDAPQGSVSLQIVDAAPRISVGVIEDHATPGGSPGMFRLTRDGTRDVPLDVAIRMTGPAENGVDYTYIPSVVHFNSGQIEAKVPLNAILGESTRSAIVAELVLETGAGYTVNPAAQTEVITILPSLPLVTVETYEPLAVQSDGTPGSFIFRREGPSGNALTVLFDLSGTALMGRDYQRVTRWVVFNPKATTVIVPINPSLDGVLNGVKTIQAKLVSDSSYNLGVATNAEIRLVSKSYTFGAWKRQFFPANSDTAAAFGVQDADGDGIENLAEYGYGLDATKADVAAQGLPRAVIVDGHLGIRFTRPVGILDMDYVVESSTDLSDWRAVAGEFDEVAELVPGSNNEVVTWLDRNPTLSQYFRRYLRVKVMLK